MKEKQQVANRRLDDMSEIAALDMLKIDVQGTEVSVFKGGREHLLRAVAVHTEVCFLSLYKGQPLFGEIDLRAAAASASFRTTSITSTGGRSCPPTTRPPRTAL